MMMEPMLPIILVRGIWILSMVRRARGANICASRAKPFTGTTVLVGEIPPTLPSTLRVALRLPIVAIKSLSAPINLVRNSSPRPAMVKHANGAADGRW